MTVHSAREKIVKQVASWDGVVAMPHRFGGTEFRLGRRELGHVRGDHEADIPFPIEIRNQLIAKGKAEPHHIIPESGWITFRFRKPEDVEAAVKLFKMSCELAAASRAPKL
ncbi:MAG: DUF5519 family protein [Nitrososphaerota archaeon]|nr:DUF5519 family protein [Nitrososphaerota archaeon]